MLCWYLRELPALSVLLLEEPESFVSPGSQERVADLLATAIDDKKIAVVVTTHSPALVQRCPRECVQLVIRDVIGVSVRSCPSDQDLASAIGYKRGVGFAFLVEDRNAADMVRVFLRILAPRLLSAAIFVEVRVDDIQLGLKHAVERGDGFRHVGIYDGDQRATRAGIAGALFLPTDTAPEIFLRTAALSDPKLLAQELGRDMSDIRTAFLSADGLDHHDWYEIVRQRLGITGIELMRALVQTWMKADATNEDLAKSFVEDLLKSCYS
jgi:hypothetical protein